MVLCSISTGTKCKLLEKNSSDVTRYKKTGNTTR